MSRFRQFTVQVAIVMAVLLAGCSAPAPERQLPGDPLEPRIATLLDALAAGDLTQVATTSDQLAQADLAEILKGMDGHLPEVVASEVTYGDQLATVPLHYTWTFPSGEWTYDAVAQFRVNEDQWVLQWEPDLLHPELTSESRLVHTRTAATRGKILGQGGTVLMETMPVLRLGLDKTRVDQEQWADSAAELARFLDIDVDRFVQRVEETGDQAFVEGKVVREARTEIDPEFADIKGAVILDAERVLATHPGVATEILGTAGEATAEVIEKAGGRIQAGDMVGLSGLQQRYDEQLSGQPGAKVTLVPRPPVVIEVEPSDRPSGSPLPTPTGERKELVAIAPVTGKDLEITLDIKLQARAEKTIAKSTSPAALAVVEPKSGAIRAIAVSDSAQGQPLATMGRYAPGSTFKVVTALALLRAGLDPDSYVDCPTTTVVDGRVIKNYSDFPPNRVGRMRLVEAIALSCNTAFVNERDRLSADALREAAASLGMGVDHDAGFPVFYGDIPDPKNIVGLAEASFGQGTVQASPLAMAGVAASVSAGRTTVPYLVKSNQPEQKGKPLTDAEARDLRTMMGAVVSAGSGRSLNGLVDGAKTGTAEYGTDNPPKTHAWMIAYNDDLSIAMMVTDGASGSGAAGPYIKDLLS